MIAVSWSHISAVLLLISGGTKLRDPAPTVGAMRVVGLPASVPIAVAIGLSEIVVASLTLAVGGLLGGLGLMALYVAFSAFVTVALRRNSPIQSCGCFGRQDTPPSLAHLAINITAALSGAWIAWNGGGDLPSTLGAQPALGIPYLGFVALGTVALYLLLAELPRTLELVETRP